MTPIHSFQGSTKSLFFWKNKVETDIDKVYSLEYAHIQGWHNTNTFMRSSDNTAGGQTPHQLKETSVTLLLAVLVNRTVDIRSIIMVFLGS